MNKEYLYDLIVSFCVALTVALLDYFIFNFKISIVFLFCVALFGTILARLNRIMAVLRNKKVISWKETFRRE